MTMKRAKAELSAAPVRPALPRQWTQSEIERDVILSRKAFIERREAEIAAEDSPYNLAFDEAFEASGQVIEVLPRLLPKNLRAETLASVFEKEATWTAMRYLAGPPISADDMHTLLRGRKVTAKLIRRNQRTALALSRLLHRGLDTKGRFGWIAENRKPSRAELKAAQRATAVSIASQRAQTGRRKAEKQSLETGIAEVLEAMQYVRVPTPQSGMQTLREAPKSGTYMSGCNIGDHNADFVVGLLDGRILAIECKASNSELNSRKRISKETERDAAHWSKKFGEQVIASVVLRGVFAPTMILQAENAGLSIFWEHRLKDLKRFLTSGLRVAA